MKIAVSVETNDELESVVAHHFGRCPFFALVDVEGNEFKAVKVI
ncbi:MAG: NifB/NifX family molybdenum-iron cluster-binding protein, partial [Anaerolineales bacterium]